MSGEEIVKRVAQLSGASTQSVYSFCSQNMITYDSLNSFYTQNGRLPSIAECAKLRGQQNKTN